MTMKRLSKRFLPFIIIIMAFALFYFLVYLKSPNKPSPVVTRAWPVDTVTLQRGSHRPSLLLYAKVDSTEHALIRSEVTATVQRILVRDGQSVRKGQLMVQLSSKQLHYHLQEYQGMERELMSRVQQEKYHVDHQKKIITKEAALLKLQRAVYQRKQKLFKQGHLSKQDLDQSQSLFLSQQTQFEAANNRLMVLENQLAQFKAKLSQAQARVNRAQDLIDKCMIKSPFNGVVTSLNVATGQLLSSGSAVLKVLNNEDVEARALIPVLYLPQVQQAMRKSAVSAVAKIQGHYMNFTLQRLSGEIKPGELGQEAVFKEDSSSSKLISGDVFPIVMSLPVISNSYVIPLSALYNKDKVYLIKNKRLRALKVKVLGRIYRLGKPGLVILGASSLNNQDVLLANQLPNAVDGLLIKPRNLR